MEEIPTSIQHLSKGTNQHGKNRLATTLTSISQSLTISKQPVPHKETMIVKFPFKKKFGKKVDSRNISNETSLCGSVCKSSELQSTQKDKSELHSGEQSNSSELQSIEIHKESELLKRESS